MIAGLMFRLSSIGLFLGSAHLLAASGDIPPLPPAVNYGLLGIAVTVLATGRVVVPTAWLRKQEEATAREAARADRLEEEVKRLNTVFADQAIPAIVSSTSAVQEATSLVRRTLEGHN